MDVAVNGFRARDLRNGFAMPFRSTFRAVTDGRRHPRWLWSYRTNGMPELKNFAADVPSNTAAQAAVLRREMDASFGWDDLRRLRDEWPGTFLVKEIVTLEDSARGAEAGVDGVVVSNHGGKQLADLPTPIDVLPSICAAAGATSVLCDSSVRRGADVVKAVALGARALLLGHATLYGLAAAGEHGVSDVIEMFKRDVDRTLALLGSPSIRHLDRSYVGRHGMV